MPIALLKFPTDLRREVFQQCDPFQLYALSKCSKRTQRSIKLGGTRNWKLQFWGGNLIVASVDGLRYKFGKTENPDEYFKTQHAGRYVKYMGIQWGDAFNMFFYLLETFRIRVVETLGIYYGNLEKFLNAARELIERKIEVEVFHIEDTSEVKDMEKLMRLLNQMNISQKFTCFQKFSSNFHHNLEKFPKEILIHYSFWFTIDQLLECSCVRIELYGSTLSNQDIDLFLQKWKSPGSFPNLRWLQIESENIDNKSPILGMIPPIEHNHPPRTRVSLGADSSILNPVGVTKEDGTVGWMKVELATRSTLKFLVFNPIAPRI
ncbi:hypothetical protein B9Z55_003677 [Caenorhabditis nigoni]|uniref:F-box domain-containing protein n=1 Tax=Caenorhabditis nigoni TaxID=1611254 RepID=A0A2G5VRF8_9PELO|nr:hypothetical protein B9Z55_003677 [Caenorhabditis nigoni]